MRIEHSLACVVAALGAACSQDQSSEPETAEPHAGERVDDRARAIDIAYLQDADLTGARRTLNAFFQDVGASNPDRAASAWCDPSKAYFTIDRLATYRPYKTNVAMPLVRTDRRRSGAVSISLQILTPDDGNIADGGASLDLRGRSVEEGWCIVDVIFGPPPRQLWLPDEPVADPTGGAR